MTVPGAAAAFVRSTADVVERVNEARAQGAPLRIAGGATWLDAGRPTRAASLLRLDGLEGIVDYTPGDLTLTARAGTTLHAIAQATAGERQWLTLDPFGDAGATLGATVATASWGPLAHAFGTPRDNVLGIEAVTGDGRIVRAGGRVVKNVAGFDLTRLFTGAWGTLGVLTEITVRLRARPEAEETWALAVPDGGAALAALLARLRTAPLAPLAVEVVAGALARRIGAAEDDVLLARLGGNADTVAAQRDALSALGDAAQRPSALWDALRAADPPGASAVRLSDLPSRFAATWNAACRAAIEAGGALVHGSPARGVARCVLAPRDDGAVERFVRGALAHEGIVIFERLPTAAWSAVPAGLPNAPLAQRVKHAFDPDDLLNPGILDVEP